MQQSTQIEKKVGQVVTVKNGSNGNGGSDGKNISNMLTGKLADASENITVPLPSYLSKQEQLEKLMELFTDRLTTANRKLADAITVHSHLFDDIKGLMDDEQRMMLDSEMKNLFAAQGEIRAIVAVIEELGFGK